MPPGDFEEALIALLGKDAGGLSATTIGRLKQAWSEEHARGSKRERNYCAAGFCGALPVSDAPGALPVSLDKRALSSDRLVGKMCCASDG